MESSYFCELGAHAKFQNPTTNLSGRMSPEEKEERKRERERRQREREERQRERERRDREGERREK